VDTQQALTSSRLVVATSRARLSHIAPALQPSRPGSQARPAGLDPWLELEAVIDRVARFIHAQALADRTAALPSPPRRPTVTDKRSDFASCQPPWTLGNALSPPP